MKNLNKTMMIGVLSVVALSAPFVANADGALVHDNFKVRAVEGEIGDQKVGVRGLIGERSNESGNGNEGGNSSGSENNPESSEAATTPWVIVDNDLRIQIEHAVDISLGHNTGTGLRGELMLSHAPLINNDSGIRLSSVADFTGLEHATNLTASNGLSINNIDSLESLVNITRIGYLSVDVETGVDVQLDNLVTIDEYYGSRCSDSSKQANVILPKLETIGGGFNYICPDGRFIAPELKEIHGASINLTAKEIDLSSLETISGDLVWGLSSNQSMDSLTSAGSLSIGAVTGAATGRASLASLTQANSFVSLTEQLPYIPMLQTPSYFFVTNNINLFYSSLAQYRTAMGY